MRQEVRKKIIKIMIYIATITVYIYMINVQFYKFTYFSLTDVGDFETWICKLETIFYYTHTNANTLSFSP